MPIGGGRYEKEAEPLASEEAHAVLLLVVGGKRNGGMSVSRKLDDIWDVVAHAQFIADLPRLLRAIADMIENDLRPHA